WDLLCTPLCVDGSVEVECTPGYRRGQIGKLDSREHIREALPMGEAEHCRKSRTAAHQGERCDAKASHERQGGRLRHALNRQQDAIEVAHETLQTVQAARA